MLLLKHKNPLFLVIVVDIFPQVEAQLDTLVNEQAAMVLNRVGLAEAYKMVQAYQPKQVMQGTIVYGMVLFYVFFKLVFKTFLQVIDDYLEWIF